MKPKVPGNALVFTRHSNYGLAKYFHEVAERTFDGKITFCADWPGLESINLMDRFYHHLNKKDANHDFSPEELEQIIKRCPMLRTMPWGQAEHIVEAMSQSIGEVVEKANPRFLLTIPVDNYVSDLLHRLCKKRNATPLMLCSSPAPGRTMITSYGEFNKIRNPDDKEIQDVLAWMLDDDLRCTFAFDYFHYDLSVHLKEYSKRILKNIAFKGLKIYSHDPFNYRFYVGSTSSSYGKIKLANYKYKKYFDFDWEKRIKTSGLSKIFIPLSQTPEASTNYWLKDLKYIDYEKFILEVCSKISKYYLLVLKDHWFMRGIRSWEFYRDLKSISNVVLIPSEINSRNIFKQIDVALLGAGTSGIEAALRGKRVVNLSEPYYYVDGNFLVLSSPDDIDILHQKLERFILPENRKENQRKIISRMLECTFWGIMIAGKKDNDSKNWNAVSESLKKYLTASGSI
jgi:hypothetical protein